MKKTICSLLTAFALVGFIGVASAHTYSDDIIMKLPSWGNIAYETDDLYGATKDSNDEYSSISTLSYAVTLKPRGAICNKNKSVKSTWVTLNVGQLSYPKNDNSVASGNMYYLAGRTHNFEPTGNVTLVARFTPDDVR